MDNYSLWEAHEAEMERELAKRPLCSFCDNHVQEDHYYIINDKIYCPDCLNNFFRVDIEF